VLAACGGPEVARSEQALVDSGAGSGSGCPQCACPIEPRCDPALGGGDCETGCCAPAVDDTGLQRRDITGAPIYQCTTPACLSDSDCDATGATCTQGASCGDNHCTCPTDPDPYSDDDRDLVCCPVHNHNGVCCSSAQLDWRGDCVCPDSRMTDDGWGCACPPGLIIDEDGLCRCEDPLATYDPYTAACTCPPDMIADRDPYTGQLFCESTPTGCGDPHAHVDPETGECACNPGYVEGDTAGGVTAQCVPIGCGDGVCSPGESCLTCDFDCSCGPGPDAGVPDAGSGAPDAGIRPDAGSGAPDAGIRLDAGGHLDAIVIGADAGSGGGSGSGSGIIVR
jgi:hypothetical protein